jgi:GNAT superfamily N-acetyltransferase
MESLSVAKAEAIEAEFMYQYENAAPAHDQEILGIAARRLSGGVVLSARTDPSHYWSKALGFGFEEPVTSELVDRILDVYRAEENSLAVLQIAPEVLPDDWAEIRRTRGLGEGGRIAKYAIGIDNLAPAGTSDLRIAPVTKDDAERWAAVVTDGLGMPPEGTAGMLAASAGHPQFFPYAAWDGDTIVGGANLFVHDGIASLNAGGVLPSHRRRGAQGALIAARVEKARELGCRWVTAETGQPGEGESSSSMNNMLRAGLKVIYVRRNYIWRNEQ